jgi:lysophospholipase L1-like esterase
MLNRTLLCHLWPLALLGCGAIHASAAGQEATPIRLALVGDSTVASYPKPPADRPDLTGWGQVLGEFFAGRVQVLNDARSGASSKSFLKAGLWHKTLEGKPDYVFIQFGHNDQRATAADGDYQEYLAQYIDEARAAGAQPVLVTPVARRTFSSGRIQTTLTSYAEAMKKVAHAKNVPLIDLHAASVALLDQLGDADSARFSPAADDRSHFSRKGARAMAGLVANSLSEAVPALASQLKFPPELVRFVPYQANPVFKAAPGQWDSFIRERGWILREDGLWKLWYTGYERKDSTRLLGYATSPDGIAWTRYAGNPLVRDHWVEDMMVVKHEGTYYMFAEGLHDRAQLLTSKDGIGWQRAGTLDIRRKDGQPISDGPFGTPVGWRENGLWHLFYERNDLGVWLATSPDLKVWTNVQDEPIMTPGPDDYDKDLIAFNQVLKHKGRYYAFYHGSATTGPLAKLWSTAVATSTDLLHWDKYPANPLQPIRQNKSSGIVIPDGSRFRLYTMHPQVNLHLPPPESGGKPGR